MIINANGGAATSANKLNTDAGSATKPVYFKNGVPVAVSYELKKTVPADAVFTDTVTKLYSTTGSNTDGSMTQAAITAAINAAIGSAIAASY